MSVRTTSIARGIHFHAIIHKSLEQACTWGLAITNPSDKIEKPKKAKTEMHVLDSDQMVMLLDRIKDMTSYIPVLIALTTGMRRGEICGLK